MEEVFSKKLTIEDIRKLNESKPEYISVTSTKLISYELLSELDKSIQIRIVREKEESAIPEMYSVPEMLEILKQYENYSSDIPKDWSDLDKSLYVYVKMMTKFSLIDDAERTSDSESLRSILTHRADSKGLARVYRDILDNIDIPCRVTENAEGTHAWNEVSIDKEFYPVDISMDIKNSREKEQNIIEVHNFGKNPEFYEDKAHITKEKNELKLLDGEAVQASLEKVVDKIERDIEVSQASKPKVRENVKIELHSKEISGIFPDDTISLETLEDLQPLKIKVTDSNFDDLIGELETISKFYPEIMENVEIENTTTSHIDFQPVLDTICETRKTVEEEFQAPINLTIASSHEEDFDVNLSALPKRDLETARPVDEIESESKVSFRNTGSAPMKLPISAENMPKNIDVISFENFDLDGVDVTNTSARKIELKGGNSVNICNVVGIMSIPSISINNISDAEFGQLMSVIVPGNPNLFSLSINNQANLAGRRLLDEIATQNPNIVEIGIYNSDFNTIDGIEKLDGKLAELRLRGTNISINDIDHLLEFVSRPQNKYVEYNFSRNQSFRTRVATSTQISQESFNYIKDWFYYNGLTQRLGNSIPDRVEAMDLLLSGYTNIPYYIKDAEIVRNQLNLKENPVILEDESELDTVDFTVPHLQDANLLLTIPQINKLISDGKTIPQNVRIMIKDVTELDSTTLANLESQMTALGNHLTGVQIIEKDNKQNQIDPYSVAEYVYIRDTLDSIVADIDPSEPELDKFATIYTRLADSIEYDMGVIDTDSKAKALYTARHQNDSRNLLEGLRDGKCVCAGYADILRNTLKLAGLETRINVGLVRSGSETGGHAWNQVRIDGKWYFTDLTWDRQKGVSPARAGRFNECLKGASFRTNHQGLETINPETVEPDDFDRTTLRDALNRAKARSFDFRQKITIPDDPDIEITLDQDKIRDEYSRRKNDMYAKFYGDRDYQREYDERAQRHKSHEIETTDLGITYRTIEDYPEKEEDEKFLILDGYRDALERSSRYEAGDTTVYTGDMAAIADALARDKEYVETRNHTFNQHRDTQRDLATLGKYGERVPYIPRQQGVLKNIGRGFLNAGILMRNAVAPVYRVIGRYVAQPLHRLVTRGRDASPYRNNIYHRMVARRDYFTDKGNTDNPGHPIRTAVAARVNAIIKAKEGNEAVLRAGASDIKDNIETQEYARALIENLEARRLAFEAQILALESEISANPQAANLVAAKKALADKKATMLQLADLKKAYASGKVETLQTDAVSDEQHAIASKEVNTLRTTVIKGVAKGAVVKYVGPKIHQWLAERGKMTVPKEVTTQVPETKQKWVEPTYKDEVVPIYEDVTVPNTDTTSTMSALMSSNSGKQVTGFYSVYGGENRPKLYTLTGDEKITAVFQAQGNGGTGLSDIVGLKAPVLTDGTFAKDLLDPSGFLKQDTTLEQILEALNSGTVDPNAIGNLYVSVGDRYWTKLSDLMGSVTKTVQVGEEVKKVVDVEGHFEDVVEMVEKVIQTTEVVTNPAVEKAINIGSKVGAGAVMVDGVLDVAENLRKTTTDVKSNKRKPRNYTFDEEMDDVPTSGRDYRRSKTTEDDERE